MPRRFLHVFAAAVLAHAPIALAQSFPTRPITLVVPFPPGAANDLLARVIAPELKDALGAVIVDNKPGGSGTVGAQFVKTALPDGHTLLVAPNQYVIQAAMTPQPTIDLERDFTPVVMTNVLPFLLVINREALPVDSVRDLVELLKKNPGKFTYGTAGNGSPHHLAMELFKLQGGFDAVHLPYKGMAQGLPDFLSGRIQLTITGFPAVAAHMKSGKLKVVATASAKRTPLHPGVPTITEAGVPGVEVDTWQGVLAPAGTPRAIVDRLNAELNRVLRLPAVREKLSAQGMEVTGGTPEALTAAIRSDLAKFRRIVQAAGIKPD